MELRVCPSCDAFVGADWTSCRSCAQELSTGSEAAVDPSDDDDDDNDDHRPVEQDEYADHNEIEEEEEAEPDARVEVEHSGAEPNEDEDLDEELISGESEWGDPVEQPQSDEVKEVKEEPFPQAMPFTWTPPQIETPTFTPAFDAGDEGPGDPPPVEPATKPQFSFSWEAEAPKAAFSTDTSDSDDIAATDSQPAQPMWMNLNLGAATAAASLPKSSMRIGKFAKVFSFASVATALLLVISVVVFNFVGNKIHLHASSRTTTTTTQSSWVHYADPQNRYKVDLPSTPKQISYVTSAFSGQGLEAQTASGTTNVKIASINLTATAANDDQALRSFMEADARSFNAKVKSSSITADTGIRELNALYVHGETTYNTRFFIDGSTLYVINISTVEETGDADTYGRVNDSFRVLH